MAHGNQFKDDPKLNPEVAARGFKVCLAIGIVGIVASIGLGLGNLKQFYFSWLTAGIWTTTIALGGLFFVVLHHITGAMWSTSFRRIAENMASAAPMLALMLLPVLLLGMHDMYHWSHKEAVAADPILQGKSPYLNPAFFSGRAVFFFALWSVAALFYRRMSVRQDETGDVALTFRMRWWAPVSMIGFALSCSFAGFDWIMSLDPHWFSTMFGVIIFAGCAVSGYATLCLTGVWLNKNDALTSTLTEHNYHDVAKLMFGFTCFWAYTSFCQYMLIWYGNIPEETAWFGHRSHDGWERIAILLIVGHFVLPFVILMSRHVKRTRAVFALMAGWLLFVHYMDLYWMIMPTLHHHLHFSVVDITSLVAFIGMFGAWMCKLFERDAAVPYRDPQLHASLNYDIF